MILDIRDGYRNAVAGSYSSNAFGIRLEKDYPVFEQRDSKFNVIASDRSFAFALLIHEYFHYLHNLSTLSGLMLFAISQEIASIKAQRITQKSFPFIDTAVQIDKERLERLKREKIRIEGEYLHRTVVKNLEGLSVSKLTTVESVKPSHITEEAGREARVTLTSRFVPGMTTIYGAYAIDEGIAYGIDRIIDQETTTPVPSFPYHTLKRIASRYGVYDAQEYLRLATLALNTDCPGVQLAEMFSATQKRKKDKEHFHQMLDRFIEGQRVAFEFNLKILEGNLGRIVEMYKGRGTLESVIERIAKVGLKLVKQRISRPFLGIDNILEKKFTDFTQFLVQIAPCPVIQSGDTKRPPLHLEFGDGTIGASLTGFGNGLAVLHCQQHFVSYSDQDSSSNDICPYYSVCTFPQRDDKTCTEDPWDIPSHENGDCWYRTAISCTAAQSK